MKVSFFIAQRLMAKAPLQSKEKQSGFSKLIINLALSAVWVSVMVMILSICIVKGYQNQVQEKLTGFHAPIQLANVDLNNSFETLPLERDSLLEVLVPKASGVKFLQTFATKAGIIKTNESFEGIVLKGVGSTYNWDFLSNHLIAGKLPSMNDTVISQDIFISAITANRMQYKLGDPVLVYFVQDPPRVRKFKIVGIFDTGMGELDELYAFVDIKQVQKLNNWTPYEVSGYEIGLNQFDEMYDMQMRLTELVPFNMAINCISDVYPALFDWLKLLDLNALIILVLMLAVASINMITALLILILERTQMIGVLKAMGAQNNFIGEVFLWMAAQIIAKGLLLGNLFGLGLAYTQQKFGWIKLDQKSYYLNKVPIEFDWQLIAGINLLSFLICLLILLIPVRMVSRINPVKTIQFN
jgi:lipoprotein-releasing system permease protein